MMSHGREQKEQIPRDGYISFLPLEFTTVVGDEHSVGWQLCQVARVPLITEPESKKPREDPGGLRGDPRCHFPRGVSWVVFARCPNME